MITGGGRRRYMHASLSLSAKTGDVTNTASGNSSALMQVNAATSAKAESV